LTYVAYCLKLWLFSYRCLFNMLVLVKQIKVLLVARIIYCLKKHLTTWAIIQDNMVYSSLPEYSIFEILLYRICIRRIKHCMPCELQNVFLVKPLVMYSTVIRNGLNSIILAQKLMDMYQNMARLQKCCTFSWKLWIVKFHRATEI